MTTVIDLIEEDLRSAPNYPKTSLKSNSIYTIHNPFYTAYTVSLFR